MQKFEVSWFEHKYEWDGKIDWRGKKQDQNEKEIMECEWKDVGYYICEKSDLRAWHCKLTYLSLRERATRHYENFYVKQAFS